MGTVSEIILQAQVLLRHANLVTEISNKDRSAVACTDALEKSSKMNESRHTDCSFSLLIEADIVLKSQAQRKRSGQTRNVRNH